MPNAVLSIAIVDDEESVRVAMRRLCRALGFDATAFASGLAFIESVEADDVRADCLLLDAHMPAMTGLEVHKHLVGRGDRIPTIVCTADDAPEVRARYLAAGVADYLRKPIGADELLAAIERAVAAPRATMAARR
jgi:FixJ family two-component response regulator